jgi:predicted ATP-dependent serine protease
MESCARRQHCARGVLGGIAVVSPAAMSLDAPVVCPSFTSRDHEQDSLRQVAARVADGLGQVVLISGEAGIGKSRLVHELCDGLADQGWIRGVLSAAL